MKPLNILYLEDSSADAMFAGRVLEKAGLDFNFRLVDTEHEYVQALGEYQPDVVLADHSLFQFNSSEALRLFREKGMRVPFILVTGTVSEEFAVNILKEGADDYLLKSNLTRLPNAILSSLEKYRIEKERQEYLSSIIANEALMKEAEKLALFGSWEADAQTGEVKWSDGIFRICGYEPGAVEPGHAVIIRHIHPEDRAEYQRILYSGLGGNDQWSSVFRWIDAGGGTKYISSKIVVKRDENEQFNRLIGFMQDITEKTTLEKELAMQAVYQQKLITEVTIQAQEKERNELGRELHDNINQVLATVKMYLKMASEKDDAARRLNLVEKSFENIDYAIEEIRKLSRSLVAPSLGDLGLTAALQDLADEINTGGKPEVLIVNEMEEGQRLDKNLELMLYRIAQEQLNNIRKYANAGTAVISLEITGEHLFFSVTDNGSGFNTSHKVKGIGLKNIQSRVEFYSGTLKIISSEGNGCRLEIVIPMPQAF